MKLKKQTAKKIVSRKEQSDERAQKLCREVRYQMAANGSVPDNQKLFKLLQSWMRVTGKIKYVRPV